MESPSPGYRQAVRFALVVLLAAIACAVAPAATAPTLAGHVTVASSEPQCSPKGCGRPAGPVTLRFARNGRVRVVKTAAGGAFRAWLPAGTYRVSTGQNGGALSPARVTVRAGVTRRVTFVLRLNAA
jgi:hypothetical protein